MSNSLSLTGKFSFNCNNLSGKKNNIITINTNTTTNTNTPQEVTDLKKQILNYYLLPLTSKNWKKLQENMFFLENIRTKLYYYSSIYKLDDLSMYSDILKFLEYFVIERNEVEKLEKQLYYDNDNNKVMASMIYKTAPIKLKPEYEIYDFIIGKPDRKQSEKYDNNIIIDIQILLKKENITFNIIENFVKDKYFINTTNN